MENHPAAGALFLHGRRKRLFASTTTTAVSPAIGQLVRRKICLRRSHSCRSFNVHFIFTNRRNQRRNFINHGSKTNSNVHTCPWIIIRVNLLHQRILDRERVRKNGWWWSQYVGWINYKRRCLGECRVLLLRSGRTARVFDQVFWNWARQRPVLLCDRRMPGHGGQQRQPPVEKQ